MDKVDFWKIVPSVLTKDVGFNWEGQIHFQQMQMNTGLIVYLEPEPAEI